MKPFFTILILFCITSASFAQRVASSCDAPDSIKKRYKEDAAWLAFQYEQQIHSPYLDSVIIPQYLQDKFMNALLAVYNVKGMLTADSVTRIPLFRDYTTPSKFHPHHPFLLGTVFLNLDTSLDWQKRFLEGLRPTGYLPLDTIIKEYNILFDTLILRSNEKWFATMMQAYNILMLDSLVRVATNSYSFFELYGFCCGGDGIEGEIKKDGSVKLSYSLGWIDCELGCLYRRYWYFTIFPDCSVEYNGAFTRTPENWKVDSNLQNYNDLTIYPNPATGVIIVQTHPLDMLEILDIQGKVLTNVICTQEKTEVTISSLPKGTYFVRIESKSSEISSAKFIKE